MIYLLAERQWHFNGCETHSPYIKWWSGICRENEKYEYDPYRGQLKIHEINSEVVSGIRG
jgi:hypothetical protein